MINTVLAVGAGAFLAGFGIVFGARVASALSDRLFGAVACAEDPGKKGRRTGR